MFLVNMNVIELGVPIPEKISSSFIFQALLRRKLGLVVTPLIVSQLFYALSTHGLQNTTASGFPSVPLADPSQASWKQSVLTGQTQPLVFLSALTMPTAVVILATSMPRASPTSPTMILYTAFRLLAQLCNNSISFPSSTCNPWLILK